MNTPSKLFLWEDRSLYLGVIRKSVKAIQPASSLVISLGGTLKVSANKDEVLAKSILIKQGELVTLDPGMQPFALCFLDAWGQDYAKLSARMQKRCGALQSCISDESAYISELKHIYQGQQSAVEVHERLRQLVLDESEGFKVDIDTRIAKVLELIHQNVNENLSASELAESIELSRPRLFQLFKEQIGCPIRRYRLWHRVFYACKEISKTKNAVWSAQCAGFSDAAHFNRTFKRMLGVTPSELFEQENGIEVYCE